MMEDLVINKTRNKVEISNDNGNKHDGILKIRAESPE